MTIKYFTKNNEKKGYESPQVTYCFLDDDNKIVGSIIKDICFRLISRGDRAGEIPKGSKKILFYHNSKEFCYDENFIMKWLSDINEMGFKCNFLGESENKFKFEIPFKENHNNKVLIFCTLILIRYLFENCTNIFPEIYRNFVDTGMEKFQALQECHRQYIYQPYVNHCFPESPYLNNGHALMSSNNIKYISLEDFKDNIFKYPLYIFDTRDFNLFSKFIKQN